MKLVKTFGLATFLSYIISNIILFISNIQYLKEVERLSVTFFNIEGVAGQYRIIVLNYLLPGLLIALFALFLSREYSKQTEGRIGCYLLVLSGICWASIGLNPIFADVKMRTIDFLIYVKIFFAWTSGAVAMILISSGSNQYIIGKQMKWYSILLAGMMLLYLVYLFFWPEKYSGIVTSIGWTAYFGWFALFLTQKNHKSTMRILNPS